MPVTFTVASHPAKPPKPPLSYERNSANEGIYTPVTATSILQSAAPEASKGIQEMFHSSINEADIPNIIPSPNGFVYACIQAYNEHQNLMVRPDDVWLCILTQFSLYVNSHGEEMRNYFVTHDGREELVVAGVGNIYTADFGELSVRMGDLLDKNILDKELHQWIIPDFTTTTTTDIVCSSIVMMATLKSYFTYKIIFQCGIPTVTLLGEKSDYESILTRLSKLSTFGPGHEHLVRWQAIITPIITSFVSSFDLDPVTKTATPAIIDFWAKIISYQRFGSGSPNMSGWLTAFCVFGDKGEWQGGPYNPGEPYQPNEPCRPEEPESSKSGKLKESKPYSRPGEASSRRRKKAQRPTRAEKSETRNPYPTLTVNRIPLDLSEVKVKVDDHGRFYDTTMIAGLVGYKTSGRRETVAPYPGWFIFTKDVPP